MGEMDDPEGSRLVQRVFFLIYKDFYSMAG